MVVDSIGGLTGILGDERTGPGSVVWGKGKGGIQRGSGLGSVAPHPEKWIFRLKWCVLVNSEQYFF